MSSRVVYVGNLPLDVRERELEDLFYKYGRIERVDLKLGQRPPGFAFVEYTSSSAAYDAVKGRDGYDFYGSKLRVELSNGGSQRAGAAPGGGAAARGLGPSPFGPSRRTEYRVIVTGLPQSCSWQDLKDHMRRAGEVTFTQVLRDPDHRGMMGLVDYATHDDMSRAIRKLDDTEFKNIFDRGYIRVKEDRDRNAGIERGAGAGDRDRDERRRSRSRSKRSRSRSRRRSRSASRSKSQSKSRSRSRSKSQSKSRSKSPARKASRSASKSKSRSRSRSPAARKSRSRSLSRSPRRSPSKSPAAAGRRASRSASRSPRRSRSPAREDA